MIDGITAPYNVNCRDAMKMTVNGSFRMWEHKNALKPSNTAKLQLALNSYTTGTSNVYAYCDFNNIYMEFARFADFENTKQYVKFTSRIVGAWFSDIGTYRECIKEGKQAQLGYDVGFCYGGIGTLLLDTLL